MIQMTADIEDVLIETNFNLRTILNCNSRVHWYNFLLEVNSEQSVGGTEN